MTLAGEGKKGTLTLEWENVVGEREYHREVDGGGKQPPRRLTTCPTKKGHAQKESFSANCRMRGSKAACTWPYVEELRVVFMVVKPG